MNNSVNFAKGTRQTEARLLSALREGEMLRFVTAKDKNGRLATALEGDGPHPENLRQRVDTILKASVRTGHRFRSDKEPGVQNMPIFDDAIPPLVGRLLRVVDLVPRTRTISPGPASSLGFCQTALTHTSDPSTSLRLPDFPPFHGQRLTETPTLLMAAEQAVVAVEIEFTRHTLSEQEVRDLDRFLEREIELARLSTGVGLPVSPVTSFLALWSRQRSGWRLRCRVVLDRSFDEPSGAVEVAGHEIFGAECELKEAEPAPYGKRDSLCLGSDYPEGWLLPLFLPQRQNLERLDAATVFNSRLPELPTKGILIGRADGVDVRLPSATRDRHVYVVGGTGTGKTTLFKRMIAEDLKRREALVLLDPHGDLFHEVRDMIPKKRLKDVVEINPDSPGKPIRMNVLDIPHDHLIDRRAAHVIGELLNFFMENWDCPEAFGPMFELYFRNAMSLLIYQTEGEVFSISDFEAVFSNKGFRNRLLLTCQCQTTRKFWLEIAEKVTGEASLANITPYIISKVTVLTHSGFVKSMLDSRVDQLKLDQRLDSNAIVLVNLNKGTLGSRESRLLGILLVSQIFSAGLKRAANRKTQRKPVNVYIDEFQNFVSGNVASMLAEARKFGLRLNLANQTLGQLKNQRNERVLLDAVLGNVANIVTLRLGVPDAELLKPFLEPFSSRQIQRLPNYHALVRLLDENGPIGPLILRTLKK